MLKTNVVCYSNYSKKQLKANWLALYRSSRPNFFLSWSWIGNWLNSFEGKFIVCEAKIGDEIVGLGILIPKSIIRKGFVHSRQLHLHRTGNEKLDQTWIEYNDFLLAEGTETSVRKAMIDSLLESNTWDEIIIGASQKNTLTPFYMANLNEQLVWHSHSYQVDLTHLRDTKTEYLSTLSKNTRYQINRSIRSYEKLGKIELSEAMSPEQALKWFDEAAPFHINRWKNTKVGSGFTNPIFVKFHHDLITKNFERGFVDVLKITAGDHVICYLYNFVQGTEVKFYLSANNYDENDSTYKPGLVSHYLAIMHYLNKDFDVYDFMAGESQYKRSLSSMSSPIYLSVFNKPKLRFAVESKLRRLKDKYMQKREVPVKTNTINVILTGGQENTSKDDPKYNNAKIVHCEISSDGTLLIRKSVDYSPEPNLQSQETNVIYKSGSVHNGVLSVVTETEVHKYSLPDFTLVKNYSLPCFNDLHHVFEHNGKDYVVNTGLDSVVEVVDGKDTRHFSTFRNNELVKHQPNIDYRQIASTKPHLTHPNFGFVLDGKLWATRCDTMDAICLEDDTLRLDIGQDLVHDGVVYKNSIYFTNVDGQIQAFDAETRKLKLTSNLNHFIADMNGWCRGVLPVSSNLVLVGFSKSRSSKKLSSSSNSHGKIILIDILKHQKVWEVNTSDIGLDAIFSILPGDQS